MIHEKGFKGIKVHPYYQSCNLDDEKMFPIYEKAQRCGLVLLCHTGFDIAFPRDRKCDPRRILKVVETFPRLLFVATHLGAWEDWEEVRKYLLGKPIYMEISFAIEVMGEAKAREFMLAHPEEYLLFGTDSPWTGQKETLHLLLSLKLGPEKEKKILFKNARKLLGLG
jgi:hypothetical protein